MASSVGVGVSAAAWAVADEHGSLLFHHKGHVPRSPASLTKLVTALAALRCLDSWRPVATSAAAAGMRGTTAALRGGDTVPSLRAALMGMLLPSGNDMAAVLGDALEAATGAPASAALAAAAHACVAGVAGSGTCSPAVKRGGALATQAAPAPSSGGCSWANPHGLDEEGHEASAAVLAAVGAAVMKAPSLARIACTSQFDGAVTGTDGPRSVTWQNTHKFVREHGLLQSAPLPMPQSAAACGSGGSSACSSPPSTASTPSCVAEDGGEAAGPWEGVDMGGGVALLGGKTGTTRRGGYCLFTALRRGGRSLCIVVLGARSKEARYTDTLRLARGAWAALGGGASVPRPLRRPRRRFRPGAVRRTLRFATGK